MATPIPLLETVGMLAEVGAWDVNLHDNHLVPIDATPAERDLISPRSRTHASATAWWFLWLL